MSHLIRPAERRDADALTRLAAEFYAYLRTLGSRSDSALTPEAYLRDAFGEKPRFSGFVAEIDSTVVGYAFYQIIYDTSTYSPSLFLTDLFVSERCRRRGIGESLMKRVAETGKTHGATLAIWPVFKPNQLARDFYLKQGGYQETNTEFMLMDL